MWRDLNGKRKQTVKEIRSGHVERSSGYVMTISSIPSELGTGYIATWMVIDVEKGLLVGFSPEFKQVGPEPIAGQHKYRSNF